MNQEQDLPELPEEIDIPMIEMIHSGQDSFVPFMRRRKDGGGLENLCCIPRETLRSYFPELLKWLTQDSYMGVNSYYRPAMPLNKKTGEREVKLNKTTGLPDVWRKEINLRYLNAAYADLDVGRPDSRFKEQWIPWIKAQGMVEKMMAVGKLPQASIYAPSGRGLYLLWLIRDAEDPNLPQKAFEEKLQLYKKINRTLALKLRRLGLFADQVATDGARVLKAPGTIDSRSGNQVRYFIRVGDKGLPYMHTLDGLAEALQVRDHEKELTAGGYALPFYDMRTVSEKGKGKFPQKLAGFRARNLNRARDLLKIESLHGGGFPHGKRRRSLTLLAEFLRFSGTAMPEIKRMIGVMAARCVPPYPSDKSDTSLAVIVRNVLHGPSRLSRSGNAALCRYYEIDREVAIDGELESILPADLQAEEKASARQEKATAKAEELAAVKRLWEGSGKGCAYRPLAEALTASGFPMSKDKVMRILNRIRADRIKGNRR